MMINPLFMENPFDEINLQKMNIFATEQND